MKVLLVGGTFSDTPKESGLVNKVYNELSKYNFDIDIKNGGLVEELPSILESVVNYDFVFWWCNVLGDVPKYRNVKDINPKCILIGSKRNNNEYEFGELIKRALELKQNLCIEFRKIQDEIEIGTPVFINMRIFDPLGNMFYDGTSIKRMVEVLVERMTFLKGITRKGTKRVESDIVVENSIDSLFLELIKGYAETFHELIQAQTSRFLGNCSTRCMRGFPSQRIEDYIYVSRRNVDKRYIDESAFVKCVKKGDDILYWGDNKPSVDTPIQLALYEKLPNINFMIHSHCYIKDAPFTKQIIPCGGLEEVQEILDIIPDKTSDYIAVNLLGHGSTIMTKTSEQLKNINYYGRILPERFV